MKRNQSIRLGAILAAVAMIVIASGCSSNNPVAPDVSSDIVFENPQSAEFYPNVDDSEANVIDAEPVHIIEDAALESAID